MKINASIKQSAKKENAAITLQNAIKSKKAREEFKKLEPEMDKRRNDYGNLKSELNTRGKYDRPIINDIMDQLDLNRKGIKNLKQRLGIQKKLGRPTLKDEAKRLKDDFKGQKQTEI